MSDLEQYKTRLLEAEEREAALEAEMTELKSRLAAAESAAATLQSTLSKVEAEAKTLSETVSASESKISALKKSLAEYKHQLTASVEGPDPQEVIRKLNEQLAREKQLRNTADAECNGLRKEIQDLSESLFSEANQMVADARREAHDYQVRNQRLTEDMNNKKDHIEILESQLADLKITFRRMEDESVSHTGSTPLLLSTPTLSGDAEEGESGPEETDAVSVRPDLGNQRNSIMSLRNLDDEGKRFQTALYAPLLRGMRFDLSGYEDFKWFVTMITEPGFVCDIANLNNSVYFNRVYKQDVEPTLNLAQAPKVSFFNRKMFVKHLADGNVVIEPISGINETYRNNFFKKTHSDRTDYVTTNMYLYPKDSPPVATKENCGFCDESRNDVLEHSRLYYLRIGASTKPKTDTEVAYPMCQYCLGRIRAVCEFFSTVRLISMGVMVSKNQTTLELSYRKCYVILSKVRAKMLWARVGIWENPETVLLLGDEDIMVYLRQAPPV